MKVTLNKSQLEHISKLIEMKGVKYYDVKMEMTDHIASEVEELLEKEHLAYMDAVKRAFLKYNRSDFFKIEKQKKRELQKQATKFFYSGILRYFTFPKIVLSGAVYSIAFLLVSNIHFGKIAFPILILGNLTRIAIINYRKQALLGKPKYLQLTSFRKNYFGVFIGIIVYGLWIYGYAYDNFSENYLIHIESGLITVVVLSILTVFEIYANQINSLKKDYT